MVDQIEMALDDIIKANKKTRIGGGAGRKFDANKRTGRGGGAGFRSNRSGGVQRGRNRGGITKSTNYSRVTQLSPALARVDVNKVSEMKLCELTYTFAVAGIAPRGY